jgi:hypothetical protein
MTMARLAPKFTIRELIDCAEREIARRKRVYPSRMVTQRWPAGQEAIRQIAMMMDIRDLLRALEQDILAIHSLDVDKGVDKSSN